MLLLTIEVVVVLTYVLTFKVHIRPARTVPIPLDSLSPTSASCDLLLNHLTCLLVVHSKDVSSPDTTPIGLPRTLRCDSTDAHKIQLTSFIRKYQKPQLPKFWLNHPQGYFYIMELLFVESNITSEHTKFALLATALSDDNKAMLMISGAWPQFISNESFSTIKNVHVEAIFIKESGLS